MLHIRYPGRQEFVTIQGPGNNSKFKEFSKDKLGWACSLVSRKSNLSIIHLKTYFAGKPLEEERTSADANEIRHQLSLLEFLSPCLRLLWRWYGSNIPRRYRNGSGYQYTGTFSNLSFSSRVVNHSYSNESTVRLLMSGKPRKRLVEMKSLVFWVFTA